MFIYLNGIICNVDRIHSIRIVKRREWDVEVKMDDGEIFLTSYNNEGAAHAHITQIVNTLNGYPN